LGISGISPFPLGRLCCSFVYIGLLPDSGGYPMIARIALRKIFERIGKELATPLVHVEFSDGSIYRSPGGNDADVAIRFRRGWAEWYTLLFFYEGLFECYVNGEVDLEGDRPITTLGRWGHSIGLAPAEFWRHMLSNPLNAVRQWLQEIRQDGSSREQAIRNAEFHYSLHPALFEHMLGETLGYSEGLWTAGTRTLNQAKFNNYEYICRKLLLKPGMKVIEVGPGWGYMPIYMVKRYGVDVTVYNPVRRQNDYMRERFHRHGVAGKIRIVEGDHRDIANEGARFDRFVSIGVQEHAGYRRRQYRLWADSISAVLKPDGVGVVSTTSFMIRQMTNLLTLKYIFPGGHLPSLPETLIAFDRAGLMLVEVENLWPHYQRTMDEWRRNFARHWPDIQKSDPAVFTEQFRRAWTMYLEGTVEVFRDSLDLSHIIFTKGRNADYCPPLRSHHHTDAELIGGEQEPDCYR
jgi:cyclopropane-fatty-acyl-phospholipid synthase